MFVPDPASVGQHVADVAFEMARRGYRVRVYTANRGYDDPTRKYPPHESINGVDVVRLPLSSFGKKSMLTRIIGTASFMVQAFVGPESLGFLESVLFLVAIVLGGLGTILGSIFGALFLTFQIEAIDRLGGYFSEARELRGVIYGAALVIAMILLPRGAAGAVHTFQQAGPAGVWESVRDRARSLALRLKGLPEQASAQRSPQDDP